LKEEIAMRVALYARVSTETQHTDNQLAELKRYADARGWPVNDQHVYIDHGVSGNKESRPALDAMLKDAKRRRFDLLLVWRLDRLGRSLKHLVVLLDDLRAFGVQFASLNEAIDTSTPSGQLMLHLLAAFAQFERERIRERVFAGLARARQQGKVIGRPRLTPLPAAIPPGMTVRALAAQWRVSKSTAARWLASGQIPQADAGVGQPHTDTPDVSPHSPDLITRTHEE
jgi:DNA invertase Pin-like site-specific DNA recombinase